MKYITINTYEANILLFKENSICTLENNVKKEYDIEIQKIYSFNNNDNKSMLIKVADEELIEKTGGIIQRYEWKSNHSKWKIYWSCNTCFSIRSNSRVCGFCGYDDKGNEVS